MRAVAEEGVVLFVLCLAISTIVPTDLQLATVIIGSFGFVVWAIGTAYAAYVEYDDPGLVTPPPAEADSQDTS